MRLKTIRFRKMKGGFRRVESPPEQVKVAQRQLLRLLTSYDSVKGMSAQQALSQFQRNINEGFQWVASLDIRNCFPSINPETPLAMLDTRITGGVPGQYGRRSLPQGHPFSPLLAELHLSQFDRLTQPWKTSTLLHDGSTMECRVIRYVDNIWLMCRKRRELEFHLSLSLSHLSDLGLTPRVESIKHVNQGIDFLGYTVKMRSIRPNPRNIQRLKDRCMRYALDRKQLEDRLSSAGNYESRGEVRAEIDCLDRKFKESLRGWESQFGLAMRPWLQRFLSDSPLTSTPTTHTPSQTEQPATQLGQSNSYDGYHVA